MKSSKASQPFFFSPEDEADLSIGLLESIPGLRFLDDHCWPGSGPVYRDSIGACSSRFVYFWDTSKLATLPTLNVRGALQGPASGVVIQFMRSACSENTLFSGQMGVGYSESWVGEFWKRVLQISRRLSSGALIGPTGESVNAYLVGRGAVAFSRAGGRLKHASAEVFYRAA